MDTPEDLPELRLARVEAMVFRVPISTPVVTSFGTMTDRPAVVVRIEDTDGAVGWGEVWCNFPNVGAEHRARMLENYVAPLLLTRPWPDPIAAFFELTNRLHVLGLQCGEPGTIAQIIAGADIALWDLAGKRAGQPLWKLLGGGPAIRPYASGINPTNAERLAAAKLEEGYRAFKLKIGFGAERDLANLTALRKLLGPEMPLMADVNQAWDPATAFSMLPRLREYNLEWLEEPVPADTPWRVWQELAAKAGMPLAAGENLRGEAAFEEALSAKAIGVFQPDLGKWGGFSGCVPLGRQVKAAGYLFCPHWLGGGIGLAASMHLKAAIGGPGYLEVDANENPLREALGGPLPDVVAGMSTLSDRPGLGVDPDVKGLRSFQR
ncbi:mandelate racemase/muconate lactonizing enzyme family protein [Mesorhizobium koreense]|uniref:mandelate racemase/muconate lactonizing enzyme family protein n=1 Tax=Mesorhizobium koreense TaxID=3074855 RepID=UPI00287B7B40|nr:mandelate racemase/muconate lactonizing enzyme family protein [Mesorhizobium sp. WR6]